MTLPKIKKRKMIQEDFDKVAKEVKKTLEEQLRYFRDKQLENGNNISTVTNIFT